MSKPAERVEIITGRERRRRYSAAEKVRLGSVKNLGRLLAHLWLVGTGSVVFTSLRLAFACSGTVRYVTPAPVVRHQPAPGF